MLLNIKPFMVHFLGNLLVSAEQLFNIKNGMLSRFIGVTNKRGLDRMVGFIYHSFTITRNHNQLQ
jgi:hypothetical protein